MSSLLFCNYFSAMVITLLSERSVAATCLKHSCLWAWNFLEIFFFIETYCWQSLVYKTFTKMIQCVLMFPIKFEMRIVWRFSRFHGETPCFVYISLLFPLFYALLTRGCDSRWFSFLSFLYVFHGLHFGNIRK